jgi:hypothetical protein
MFPCNGNREDGDYEGGHREDGNREDGNLCCCVKAFHKEEEWPL